MKLPQTLHAEIDKLADSMEYGEITIYLNKEQKKIDICGKNSIRVAVESIEDTTLVKGGRHEG